MTLGQDPRTTTAGSRSAPLHERTVGIEIFYFMDRWADEQGDYFGQARSCGYGGVEISLLNDDTDAYTHIRNELATHGLSVACSTGLTAEKDVSHPDPAVRRRGIEWLKRCLEVAASLGSPILGGVTYAPWFGFPDDHDLEPYRHRSAESLAEVAVAAETLGVELCVELLNRFETHMLNTVEQANAFIDLIDHPSVKIELDTFHMSMEEADLPTAIRAAGRRLGHFQVAANNRAMPGTGHLDWNGIAAALDDVSYSGWLVVETFPNPDVETGRSTHAFRPLVDDPVREATAAATFLRDRLGGSA